MSNLDKYKADLDKLIRLGHDLHVAMQLEYLPEESERELKKLKPKERKEITNNLPSFSSKYQSWYSEAHAVIKQLLPDRLTDFVAYYERPKNRKEITNVNYSIEDCLQGVSMTRTFTGEKLVGPEAAIPKFRQQLSLLKSAQQRFESSLFDIQQLARADLLDSELDAAKELNSNGFNRAAGAVAGVVLEKHLAQVVDNHEITITKRNPHISDLNDALKNGGAIEIAQWRSIQYLGDLRNLCDHNKGSDPTPGQVGELIEGVTKVIKTLF